MNYLIRGFMLITLLSMSIFATPIDDFGQLSVGTSGDTQGTLIDKNGDKVQLKGMSLFWNNWDDGGYWNANAITHLAEDWNNNIVRAAMGASNGSEDEYYYAPSDTNDVITIVDAAIAAGIYVIIDWHGHYASSHTADAKAFFSQMAQKYGSYPNVIYEVWNEPKDDVTWDDDIKPYAQEILEEIRKYDTDNIVIVGNTSWCQNPTEVENNMLTYNESTDPNVMYTIHVYAGSHDGLYTEFNSAISKKIPLFMTEWGTTDYTGDGEVDTVATNLWMKWMKTNNISWCNWSLNDKNESASALVSGASSSGEWDEDDLTESGSLIFNYIKNNNPDYSSNGASPVITVTSSLNVTVNSSYTFSYTATDSDDGDISGNVTQIGTVDNTTEGSYTIILSVRDSDDNITTKTVTVVVSDGTTDGFIILDDFENSLNDANNQTHLGARFNKQNSDTDKFYEAGYWYTYDDSDDEGNSTASPNYIDDELMTTLETSDVNGGTTALKLDISLGDAIDKYGTAFYGVGCNLTVDGNYSNLSEMTSISFYAKGSGSMKVLFHTKEALETYSADWGHYQYDFDLTSSWRKYTIAKSEFYPSPSSTLEDYGSDFSGSADQYVTKLHFETAESAGDNITFLVDDIILNGVDYVDFQWDGNTINDGTPLETNTVPVITVVSSMTIDINTTFNAETDIDYSATDEEDGTITSDVSISGTVDYTTAGTYYVELSVTDSDDNTTTKIVSVIVKAETVVTGAYVLIDDFENSTNGNTFQTHVGRRISAEYAKDGDYFDYCGSWYTYDDGPNDGNSTATPSGMDTFYDLETATSDANSYDGISLALDIELGDAFDDNDGAYYGIGCYLGLNSGSVDLTDLTAITFYAKGSGEMMVKIKTDETNSYSWGDMVAPYTLTSSWTKYTITPSDFIPEVGSPVETAGVIWDDVKDAGTQLHFQTNQDANTDVLFYLDDIYFEGVEDSEFYSTLTSENLVTDNVPVITVVDEITMIAGASFDRDTDIDYSATDKEDGTITSDVSLSGTVDNTTAGTYYVELSVTDSDNNTTIETVTVTVTVKVGNEAPQITSTALSNATEDELYEYTVAVTDTDNSVFNYTLTDAPDGMEVSNTGLITWTPEEGITMSGIVTLTVSDGDLTDTQEFIVAVTAVNDAPKIISAATTTATEDELYEYSVVVTDPDNSLFTYTLTGAPDGMVVNSTGVVTWTPGDGIVTSGIVTLTVSDGDLVDSQNIIVAVTAINDAPTISVIDGVIYTIANDSTLTLDASDFTVEDTEGNVMTIIVNDGEGYTVDGTTIIPDSTYTGTIKVSVSVSDGELVSDPIILDVAVTENLTSSVNSMKEMALDGYSLRVAPTPTKYSGKIVVESEEDGEAVFTIYTINETKLATISKEVEAGEERTFDWNTISKLRKGIYFVELTVNGERKAISRIVKIKK